MKNLYFQCFLLFIALMSQGPGRTRQANRKVHYMTTWSKAVPGQIGGPLQSKANLKCQVEEKYHPSHQEMSALNSAKKTLRCPTMSLNTSPLRNLEKNINRNLAKKLL